MRYLIAILIALESLSTLSRARADDLPSASELGGILRSLILPNLPSPLVEQSFNWGHQEYVPVGIRWEKKGILLKPEVMKKLHNDGVWRNFAATTDNLQATFQLTVSDVKSPCPGAMTFVVQLALPVNLKFEQQLWRSGVRLYSGETRARCKVALALRCESTTRTEKKPNALLPDVIFRLRVVEAQLNYSDFVVEHTAGVGGDAAKIVGNAIHDAIKQWKPSLERKLLEKANAAIVKAGDTKEVRLGLSKLFEAAK
jgi:hypothetical protein